MFFVARLGLGLQTAVMGIGLIRSGFGKRLTAFERFWL